MDRSPRAAVLWFTGLPAAGKSTIAKEVLRRLGDQNVPVELLDGDAVRSLLPTGYSQIDREKHVRYVGFVASRLAHHGVTTICALVSPYRESRAWVRALCPRFIEIYVSTPLVECERRDPKGLYRAARQGMIADLTGIDGPYEPPSDPEMTIDTTQRSRANAADDVIELWRSRQQPSVPSCA